MEETNGPFLSDHGFEISRVVFLLIISVLLGIAAYVWTTTVTRLESQAAYERTLLSNLEERVRLLEITNERQNATLASMANRLDTQRDHIKELNDMYYGPYRKK